MKINCIICAAELENWGVYPPNKTVVHPIGGTAFRTYGNYGSSVFDPMDASYLDVVICDSCLTDRMDRAYEGINEEYKQQLDSEQAEMDEIVSQLDLEDYDKEA
jgi:hypothetical protein